MNLVSEMCCLSEWIIMQICVNMNKLMSPVLAGEIIYNPEQALTVAC